MRALRLTAWQHEPELAWFADVCAALSPERFLQH